MRVMSYSMFGGYYNPMVLSLRAHHVLFPGYQFRLYHDGCADNYYYSGALKLLQEAGLIKVIKVDYPIMKCQSMLWRLLPIWDSEVEYCFCRDLDSIPMPKERKAVEEFINSGLIVHGINDNDQHTVPLMGGMTGFKTKEFLNISGWRDFLSTVNIGWSNEKWSTHGSDQEFLYREVWKKFSQSTLIHVFSGGQYSEAATIITNANVQISDVSIDIMNTADRFSNYIGASCQSDTVEAILAYYNACDIPAIKTINEIENTTGIHSAVEFTGWIAGDKKRFL